MNDQLKFISGVGLVPVIVINDSTKAVGLARALCAGGIPVAEVTFRTEAARDAIAEMAKNVPEIIVGAGTVHSVEQAEAAVDAGAKFIVTPGFNPLVVEWCLQHNIDVFPGCSSPSDIEAAIQMGLKTVKFFPAESYGGVKTLKALSGPYGNIKFMPTGGINENNVNDYLALDNVVACGGAWMAPEKLIAQGEFGQIAELCKSAIRKVLEFELVHVGINTTDADEANSVANNFAEWFSLPVFEFPNAYFAGSMVEILKGPFLGAHGHIAVQTRDIDRAVQYFQRIGVAFDLSTENRDAAGKLITMYFKQQIGGFAVHLRRKQ